MLWNPKQVYMEEKSFNGNETYLMQGNCKNPVSPEGFPYFSLMCMMLYRMALRATGHLNRG